MACFLSLLKMTTACLLFFDWDLAKPLDCRMCDVVLKLAAKIELPASGARQYAALVLCVTCVSTESD